MQIGHQLIAPDGFLQLVKGEKYHFLKSNATNRRVFLVCFEGEGAYRPKAHLIVMSRGEFEGALVAEKIISASAQSSLPPWLTAWEGVDLAQIDLSRAYAKQSHLSRVESRLCLIGEAVTQFESIMNADDPVRQIHHYAKACQPSQNESRFCLWLLTYLCFGRNMWALLPPFQRIGRWSRLDRSDKKFGRHSIAHGAGYGFGMDEEMIKKILDGYLKYSGIGIKMTTVYQLSMSHIFKCRTTKSQSGMWQFIQPDGLRFPTYRQFCLF